MKTAIQVFTIIGIILGFITIVSPIFGFMALNQMKQGRRPEMWLCICVLLLCSPISGILMLVADDKDFV